MNYESRIQELYALKREVTRYRNMFRKLRKEFQRSGNCPLCGGVDFHRDGTQSGKHANWCFYDEFLKLAEPAAVRPLKRKTGAR
jgi:hypothetical protein